MVVASAEHQLLVAGVADAITDRRGLSEVERGAGYRCGFPGRDQLGVDRAVAVGRNGQHVAHGAFGDAFAGDVEQGVVGDVDDGRLVGRGAVGNRQLVLLVQGVGRRGGQGSRVALVAVRADIAQGDRGRRARLGVQDLPDDLVEALNAAVQGRDAVVVEGQLVGLAVQAETALTDAVGETADRGAEIAGVLGVGGGVGEAEDDVGALAVAARCDQRLQRGAIGDDRGADAMTVLEGEGLDGLARGGLAERLARQLGGARGRGEQGGRAAQRAVSGDALKLHVSCPSCRSCSGAPRLFDERRRHDPLAEHEGVGHMS